MKKVTSAALLALKLSWKAALLTFVLAAGVQTFDMYRELMPGGVPLQTTFGFETLLRSAAEPAGTVWFVMLLLALLLSAGSTKGSKSVYTLNRLGLSEVRVTLVFGLVFTGYFVLYWVMQLGLAYAWFVWYCRLGLVSSNAFMLAAWRSEWLHILLPLGEWVGYLRNAVLCLSFGFSAAIGVHRRRHGKNALASFIPAVLCVVLLTGRPAQTWQHVGFMILLTVVTAVWFCAIKGGENDEIL